MRFFVHKRRQTPAVIIVALIDVLIVLVIFLLVTTTVKQQPALRLALPEAAESQKSGANENASVIVSIDTKGNLFLETDPSPLTFEQLKTQLVIKAALNPQLKLAISGDTGAPWGQIVKVMDAAKAAKIKTVNAFTKEAGKP